LELAIGTGSLAHITFFRVLRLLRLVRAAKVLRKLHNHPEFGLILECVAGSLMPICWVFLLLGFVLYLFTAMLLQLLEPSLHVGIEVDNSDVGRLYGGFGRSIYTLLLAISGGMPWDQLVQPLSRRSSWFQLFFVVYICVVSFFVLNLLSAVFVSFVGKHERRHHYEELNGSQVQNLQLAEDLRHLLHEGSSRNDGTISSRRLERILSQDGSDILNNLKLNLQTALGIFKMTALGGQDCADINDFVCSLVQLKGNPSNIHVVSMMYESKRIMSRISALSELVQAGFASVEFVDMMPASV